MAKVLAVLAFAALAPAASANAGTPLLWAGCFYLTVANWLIGLFEAAILGRADHPRGATTLILANYASMLVGTALVWVANLTLDGLQWNSIRWGGVYLVAMWAVSFLLTLLVESPFVARAIGDRWRSRKVWLATLKVNLASYAILLVIAYFLGSTSLYTVGSYVPPERLAPLPGTVYFVRDSRVHRIGLDGRVEEPTGLSIPVDRGYLAAMQLPNARQPGLYWVKDYDDPQPKLLLPMIAPEGTTVPVQRDRNGKPRFHFATLGYGIERDFLEGEARQWDARLGFWALEGLRVKGPQSYVLAAETPFHMVFWRNLTQLPGDYAVCEADGWIVLLHAPTRRLTTLARGTNPTVVLRDPYLRTGD